MVAELFKAQFREVSPLVLGRMGRATQIDAMCIRYYDGSLLTHAFRCEDWTNYELNPDRSKPAPARSNGADATRTSTASYRRAAVALGTIWSGRDQGEPPGHAECLCSTVCATDTQAPHGGAGRRQSRLPG